MIETRLLYVTGTLFVGSFMFALLAGGPGFTGYWFAGMSIALGMVSLATGIATAGIVLQKETRN